MNARLTTGAPNRANLWRIGTRKRFTEIKSLYHADHDLRVKKTDTMNAGTSRSANSRFVLLVRIIHVLLVDSTKNVKFSNNLAELVEAPIRAHSAYLAGQEKQSSSKRKQDSLVLQFLEAGRHKSEQ